MPQQPYRKHAAPRQSTAALRIWTDAEEELLGYAGTGLPPERRGKIRLPGWLSQAEEAQLLAWAEAETKRPYPPASHDRAVFDRLLLLLGLYCGLRASEFANLDVEHVSFENRTLFVAQGKGGKDRFVPLPELLVQPLREWIGKRTTGPLFVPKRARRLTNSLIQSRVVRAGRLAGLKKHLHPHMLRHTSATRLLEMRATDLHGVKEFLGHVNITTTCIYLHMDPSRLRDAVNVRAGAAAPPMLLQGGAVEVGWSAPAVTEPAPAPAPGEPVVIDRPQERPEGWPFEPKTKIWRAIQILREHPAWSNAEIARAVGCHDQHLANDVRFKAWRLKLCVKTGHGKGTRWVPREVNS
jgi:site-specific recombinase XerC